MGRRRSSRLPETGQHTRSSTAQHPCRQPQLPGDPHDRRRTPNRTMPLPEPLASKMDPAGHPWLPDAFKALPCSCGDLLRCACPGEAAGPTWWMVPAPRIPQHARHGSPFRSPDATPVWHLLWHPNGEVHVGGREVCPVGGRAPAGVTVWGPSREEGTHSILRWVQEPAGSGGTPTSGPSAGTTVHHGGCAAAIVYWSEVRLTGPQSPSR
jgi:hypothetical protein